MFDRHSGKLSAAGVKKRDDDYATMERFIAEVKEALYEAKVRGRNRVEIGTEGTTTCS